MQWQSSGVKVMAEKRKYWIKIEKDFLKPSQIKVIKAFPNGKDYVLFYLALMLESVESVGHLRFSEMVAYNEDMLAAITDTNVDIVRSAMKLFQEIGLIQILEDSTIFLVDVPKLTGSEVDSTERVRLFRQRKSEVLQCNGDVTDGNANKEKEKEEDKEEDKEKQKQKQKDVEEIVDYLNLVCKTNYRAKTKSTASAISARLKEGYTVEDFKTVISKKYEEWRDSDMERFLRPITLFGTKFENYLNAPYVTNKGSQQASGGRKPKMQDTNQMFAELYEKAANEEVSTLADLFGSKERGV